jgi:hypothetical protein
MSYAKATLSTLKQSLADRHDSGTLPTDSDTLTLWTRLFNRGQEYCASELGLKKSTSLTTSSGVIAFPDDFVAINAVYDSNESELVQVSPDDVKYQISGTFWVTGDHDSGFSLNAADDGTYTVKYTYHPFPLSSDSDECIIPDPEAVVDYAYSMLRRSETDPIGDAKEAMDECNRKIKKIKSNYDSNNAVEGFSLENM